MKQRDGTQYDIQQPQLQHICVLITLTMLMIYTNMAVAMVQQYKVITITKPTTIITCNSHSHTTQLFITTTIIKTITITAGIITMTIVMTEEQQ